MHRPLHIAQIGPIIVIEDDQDDQDILAETFKKLGYPNQIIFFSDGLKALAFIEGTNIKPLLILSDVNMPVINGYELKKRIHTNAEVRIRCIPYLFFTTGTSQQSVQDAYAMSAQGFFIKPNTMAAIESTIKKIVDYWQECHAPGQYADSY